MTVIRPVCGLDNCAEETLRSSFELAHSRYEVIFCVASARDPVVPLVQRLIAQHRQAPAQLLVGDDNISPNPKLNNVMKGWRAAAHGWVIIADSNVLMPRDYVHRLFESWQPDTGLICSPPIGCRPDGFWAELECAFLNAYQARWQYFADAIAIGFAQGKTMLWRKSDLDAAGGPKALARELAEDAAATKVVHELGLRVRLVDGPFEQPLGYRSAAEVWKRQVRWARLRRASFPQFFAPEILSGGALPLLGAALLIALTELPTVALIGFGALWYGLEMLLAMVAGWHVSLIYPVHALLRDLMLPAVWISGWRDRAFEWRGNQMSVVDSEASVGPPGQALREPGPIATGLPRAQ